MTAKELYDIAIGVNNTVVNEEYNEITRKLKAAANKGELEYRHYSFLKPRTVAQLTEDGFKINSVSDLKGEVIVTISFNQQ